MALGASSGGGVVILVVDDRRERADRLKAMIEFMDAPNVVAASTDCWLSHAEGERLDAVFLGSGMDESAVLLKAFVAKVYARMADIDRRLRGRGDPKSVEPYDPSTKIAEMDRHIEERARAIKDHIDVASWFRRFVATVERHRVVVGTVVAVAIAVVGWVLAS